MRLELPFPPSILNPNRKAHWAKKAKATKKYRADCCLLAKTVRLPESVLIQGLYYFKVTFHAPDKRHRDRTNMEAAFKAGFDGIADAWGINDRFFRPVYFLGEPVKNGSVVIET